MALMFQVVLGLLNCITSSLGLYCHQYVIFQVDSILEMAAKDGTTRSLILCNSRE